MEPSAKDSNYLLKKLQRFCEINEQFSLAFKVTERNANLSRTQKNDLHLHYIALHIIVLPAYFQDAANHFSEFLGKIVSIAVSSNDVKTNSVLLAKIVQCRPDLQWYATKYFELNSSPFTREDFKRRSNKRSKISHGFICTDLELVESCYVLLKSNPLFYEKKWDWSEFSNQYLHHKSEKVLWIACHCLAVISHMSEIELEKLITSRIPIEIHEKFSCAYNLHLSLTEIHAAIKSLDQHPCISIRKKLTNDVVNISGVYIPKLACSTLPQHDVVIVESTFNNLKKIAFGLLSNKAICLQGLVGSGKTTLVEYVANETGRKLGEDFIKVQLGDQTDSKMLLGTYRCTDVPGEFVWQPGILTQAVLEGHWLLLEDIDSASMDIASLLSSLLESGTLTVPGYRDSLLVSPGFQLFFTQRLVSTITGQHKKHSNAVTLLEKHVLQINIDPLTSVELKQILIAHHPQCSTITDRMVSVFRLFSDHLSEVQEITLPKTNRLISTRDFFKWCTRAAIDFDVSSQASALRILQDAIDVFCCSFAKTEDALNLAKEISTHLGIINHKAEYFFKNYKPTIKMTPGILEVGRVMIPRDDKVLSLRQSYYFTRPSAILLERVMCCVSLKEPVLLVGETGTGKTSVVQYLANTVGQKLVVLNMNQQSDSADLLGGFKPVDLKFVVTPIRQEFEELFCSYFQVEPNRAFLGHVAFCYNEQRYTDLIKLMMRSCEAAIERLTKPSAAKKEMLPKWQTIFEKLQKLNLQLKQKSALAFAFIEGSLVKAVENGDWVLLDEINLASAETLECLSGLLDGSQGFLCLLERGAKEPVRRHPKFTLFACMNPSTDVGKKDLPAGLRNRFTEFFVDELTEKSDLLLIVGSYLEAFSFKDSEIGKIVDFYLRVRKEAETTLTDGLGNKPHFSLRSLCRALMIASRNPCGMAKKSLYEAFCLSFLTQLDSASYTFVERLIARYMIGDEKMLKSVLKQAIPRPRDRPDDYLEFEGYWVRKGNLECATPDDYILTNSVRKNLKDLVRIVSIGGLPVLLQGDTSVGKTSLITYLAKSSGNTCVRINNHEHTDLQEYVGSYVADSQGKLVFKEGLLVEAMRKGHWIILDELNLAPTDVLEALNRVLDDNRELFIPETQETVKANSNFMLFATQNPPGSYAGRKILSRAFRNRFIELHFNEIPPPELEFILHRRCQMAPSYAKKMINVMTELQMRRRGSAAFAGKKGFITLRDLFRWGERYRLAQNSNKLYDWDQHLADEGYLVLAGRVRRTEEKNEIITVLQKHLKREVNPSNLFTLSEKTSVVTKDILSKIYENRHKFKNIVWTYDMRQLAVLVCKAFQFKEPVLLVGETGGGKTTVCLLIAELNQQELLSVNCHVHTESSDFLGGLRPVRERVADDNKLFEWVDGPLIQAMVEGNIFLADEISLADDSVLERLNSLLEPERTLLLAEKGTDINNSNNSELIVAHENFYFMSTMNPGGDFGKKELSAALRNRFTEIWCESCTSRTDLIDIIEENVKDGISVGNQQDGSSGIGKNIMDFVDWFKSTEIGKRCTMSIRDLLTWVNFINKCVDKIGVCDAYLHGAYLTVLDGLGSGITGTEDVTSLKNFTRECESFIKCQLKAVGHSFINIFDKDFFVEKTNTYFGIKPFYVELGSESHQDHEFLFSTPTTTYNTLRLLRGMQLNKAILLEGSPGVGKTSLVTALAKSAHHKIFRVNLSDQTDISDLFGADLPVEGGKGGQFSWRDGPLLKALKQGHWILLDELNLASQSVLEGLNACLDHRGEIFIPELGKTFHIRPGTRFFGCQNPLKQGGSRRGLPQSFLNRFIQVHVSSLTSKDLFLILRHQFSELPSELLDKMLDFNSRISAELTNHTFGNKGSPWEFNLRDLTRWCEAMIYHYKVNSSDDKTYQPESLIHLIYGDRMRTSQDKIKIDELFEEVFGRRVSGGAPIFYVNNERLFIGDVSLNRDCAGISANGISQEKSCLILRSQLPLLRSLAYCVNLNWMSLLVGSSATGKSTIVRALANMVGKTLRTLPVTSAMDTTDILGGFEQTDYARHLEEIARETEQLLLQSIRSQLVKGRPCTELLRLWKGYSNVHSEVQTHNMSEEMELFLKKLDELEKIWCVLCESEYCLEKKSIHVLRRKAQKMRTSVTNEGSLNAGGKFEWVDSILIKCLQDGSWLLVDNVNLCSAAVLDRLNPLLEPNGVLTVSERGVDTSGKMVEIIPHPDFRLFLTMDPKNGEISRAMRNRGVEVYMLNETESEHRNTLDVKSLISREGLKNMNHIDCLLNLHDFISDLILSEKPNVNELLRASALISQQIQHGVDGTDAFFNVVMEIYYKTRSSMEFNCNDFSTVIRAEIRRTLDGDHGTIGFCEDVTLKTDKLHVSSKLEKIKQQASVLRQMLPQAKLCSRISNEMKYLLVNFFSISSSDDLRIRLHYFSELLGGDCRNLEAISEALCSFVGKSVVESKDFPIDCRWILEAKYLEKQHFTSNRLMLGLHIIASLKQEEFDCIEIEKENTLKEEMSLRDYLLRRCKTVIEDQFDDVLMEEIVNLLDEYNNFLLATVTDGLQMSDECVIKVLELLTWRFIFYQCTLVNVKKIDRRQRYLILTNLKVHYHWFLKYSVNKVEVLLNKRIPPKLESIIRRIDNSLGKEFSLLHKFSRSFHKHNHHPLPKVTTDEIEFATMFHDAVRGSDVHDKELRRKLIVLRLDDKDVETKTIELKSLIKSHDERITLAKWELELLPVIQHLVRLILRKSLISVDSIESNSEEIKSCLPIDLVTSLLLYGKTEDPRLSHEMTKLFFMHFNASKGGQDVILSNCGPVLTYRLITSLVSVSTEAVTKFGNFSDKVKQHRQLNLTLWRNLQQFHKQDYDYLQTERRLISDSFQLFIQTLSKSLNIQSDDFNHLMEMCLQQLSLIITDSSDLSNSFSKHLDNCARNYLKLAATTDFHETLFLVYNIHMELSYVKAVLNSRLPLIDPSAKKTLKRKYCVRTIADFEALRTSYYKMNEVYSGNDQSLHLHYTPVLETIKTLESKNQKLGSFVAVRPKEILYDEILKVVNHGFSTILSCHYVDQIIENLDKLIKDLIKVDSSFCPEDCRHILKQYESAASSFTNLIYEWSKYSPCYPDIIEPLLSNVSGFVYGLKSNLELLRKLMLRHEYKKLGIDVQEELVTMVGVPSLDREHTRYECIIEQCGNPKLYNFIEHVLGNEDQSKNTKIENLRLLKCGLQEGFNNCVMHANFTGKVDFGAFENFLKAFVNSWNEQEKSREQAEQEADSLYKTRTKCDDKPESEQIADELKELFPNYHDEDFTDIGKATNLADDAAPQSADNKFCGAISQDDIKFVVDLHLTLVQSFTKTEWLNPDKNKNALPDFVHPLMEKYKLFKQICDKVLPSLDYRMDKELMESISVLLTFVQSYGDPNNLVEHSSPVKILHNRRDFYKDSNVEEVKASFHILEELRRKITELLDEWPDHPTLQTIMTIIERVYNFDITSPLSRFLTGFEILVSKCHEWEEVAHSGVSLSQFSQTIAQQIIIWRKMELNVWKDLLNSTFARMNHPTYKWWFYLYNIMEQFTTSEEFTDTELIEALQNYVTNSSLAEFQSRLNLLHAFHCHAVHLKDREKSEAFIRILWNMYSYFQQFRLTVDSKVKELRAPIEKKLKDYVKIVRWKDVNYWAIKETVDKSHKTLHKYVREFQDVLNQPVSTYLVNTSTSNKIENVGIWDRPQRNAVKTYHYTLDPTTYVAKEYVKRKSNTTCPERHAKLLSKVDSHFTEMRKLCKDSISAMHYPKMIRTLDNLVTQIIETSSHLQGLEVDTTLSKPKQKSLAKSILHQKHRALADLFKVLSKMGLSFRTGIVEAQLKMTSEDFLLKPMDISANFSHINYNRKDEKILTIWDSCELYYLKSLMRADVLDTALKNPARDLGQPNIARCKGFSSNLLALAQKHKSQLTESSILFYYLRHYTTQMTKICEGKQFLHAQKIDRIQTAMKNVTIVMNQAKMFLNTCPEEEFTSPETSDVIVLKPVAEEFIQYKHDQLWNKTNSLLNEILNAANKVNNELMKSKGEIPHTAFTVVKLAYVPVTDLNTIKSKLENVQRNLDDLVSIFGDIKLTKSFSWLSVEIGSLITSSFCETIDSEFRQETSDLEKIVNDLSENLLRVIQDVHKKYSGQPNVISQEDDERTQIEEEHLRILIVENLEKDFHDLSIRKILNLCHGVADIFFKVPTQYLDEYKNLILHVLPLLEQIILYHQYFLTQQVSAYRVICKMNSVLLNIFIELASKGFCVPPDLSDDDNGEGMGKPSDGLGLGEGQGERDVSDKIESEDQLDDAQPPGKEKEQTEDENCREEEKGIEMSEDFDSKLQDIEPKEGEDDGDSDSNSDADEQMGETEQGANKQDKETFHSDDEDPADLEGEEEGEGGEKGEEQELKAKENEKEIEEGDKTDQDSTKEKEAAKKDINEMQEPEYDDEQTDPYHGNQPELPEPEPMDLPDDLQIDEGQEQDDENQEENPFDIDAMKDENPFENQEQAQDQKDDGEKKNEDENYSSDDEDIVKGQNAESSGEEEKEDPENDKRDKVREDKEAIESEETEQDIQSGTDLTQTNSDHVEAMELERAESTDKTVPNQSENQKSDQPNEELCQEDKPDKEGVGQSQMEENSSGHSAQSTAPQELQGSKRERDEEFKKPQKPGDSDSQRSLGDVSEPVKKKLKTMNNTDDGEDEREEPSDKSEEAEMYKHIKEANDAATQMLDVATKEQAEVQKHEVPNEEDEETKEDTGDNFPPEKDDEKIDDAANTGVQKPEKTEQKKQKGDKKQHPEGDIVEEMQEIEVEGNVIETTAVPRGLDTTYNTLYDELRTMSATRLTQAEANCLRIEVEKQLSSWTEVPSDVEADRAWQKISSMMSSLAQDLCEQLRLVLEPTQSSRLKGDYRTGRRINMRKVIPYIASQFRKDKIWLRRTKPFKREYQIVLAIDDSSSMADNHSKELAFESVALISKALSLLESGQLSVVSFGEDTEILHKLTDQFTDRSGVQLLQKFKFDQKKTCIAKLVDFVTEMFAQSQMQSSTLNAKLLVIVSDGRGVFSEGEGIVRQSVRRAKLSNIFMVFVIVDNPENKSSILDIRMPTFKDGKLLGIHNYMDVFPFSFYIILRDINSLPNVLSDALRQWFEVVSNLDKP